MQLISKLKSYKKKVLFKKDFNKTEKRKILIKKLNKETIIKKILIFIKAQFLRLSPHFKEEIKGV